MSTNSGKDLRSLFLEEEHIEVKNIIIPKLVKNSIPDFVQDYEEKQKLLRILEKKLSKRKMTKRPSYLVYTSFTPGPRRTSSRQSLLRLHSDQTSPPNLEYSPPKTPRRTNIKNLRRNRLILPDGTFPLLYDIEIPDAKSKCKFIYK